MRVVFVGPFAFYPKGTVPVRMLPLAKLLQQDGNAVEVLLPPYDNEADSGRSFRVDGVRVCNVVIPKSRLPLKYLYVAGDLVKRTLAFRPDVVHVFKPKGYSGLAAMFLILLKFFGLSRVPVVLDTDDWEGYGGFADYFLSHGLYPKVVTDFIDFQEKWLLRHADAVTAASRVLESMAVELRKSSGCDRVFYVPNGPAGIPLSGNRTADDVRKSLGLVGKKIILLYTRFFEYDVEEVVDVLARVVREVDDVMLLVVGKGEFKEEEKLLDIAKKSNILSHIVFVGWVKPGDIPSYMEVADVAIYPFKDVSLNRSKCPGKLVQLMSFGKAIVADDVGQISEYIEHGKSGILVKHGDTEEFARQVVELLNDAHLRVFLENNAKRRIQDSFNWPQLTKVVQDSYESVLKCR